MRIKRGTYSYSFFWNFWIEWDHKKELVTVQWFQFSTLEKLKGLLNNNWKTMSLLHNEDFLHRSHCKGLNRYAIIFKQSQNNFGVVKR